MKLFVKTLGRYQWVALTVTIMAALAYFKTWHSWQPRPIEKFRPLWKYQCVKREVCQRVPYAQAASKDAQPQFTSLDVCRTVCGSFGGLWPRPIKAVIDRQVVQIHPDYLSFEFKSVPVKARALMVDMTKVVGNNLVAECNGEVTEVVETPVVVYIDVKSADMTLTWDTNEEYTLDVQTKAKQISVYVAAATVYGARHALETFTQLVASEHNSTNKKCGLRLVSGAKILDYPIYKHRGLLLDTSRHFIPLKDIKRTIDGMAANKMNVFHWHATDSHSFPLESVRLPQFTRYGAYSADKIYSAEEVRELIYYAQVRGVRVVIEIDSPAHAACNGWQWGPDYGFGNLAVCVNSDPWQHLCVQPPCGQLNPANPALYSVLDDLYRDIADVMLPPALLHMGGDEVVFTCWKETEEITKYMRLNKYEISKEGFMNLWGDFHKNALQAWDAALEAAHGTPKQPVLLWSSELTKPERITKHLDIKRFVIEVWESVKNPLLKQLVESGYRTISVPRDIWYLDHGFWGTTNYTNWRKMYAHKLPRDENVLGGEVAMWTEFVDEKNLDTRVWPRAAAVAERLWADPLQKSDMYLVTRRMQRQRARLIARGLAAEVISPEWCEQHKTKCPHVIR